MANDPEMKSRPSTISLVLQGVIAASLLAILAVLVSMNMGTKGTPVKPTSDSTEALIAKILDYEKKYATKETQGYFDRVKQQMDGFQKTIEQQNSLIEAFRNSPKDDERVAGLQKAIDEQKAKLQEYLDALSKHEEEKAKEPAAAAPLPEPPKPTETPLPQGPGGIPVINPEEPPPGPKDQSAENMKKFAAVVGIALCYAQPEFCPFVAVFASLFGGGNTYEEMRNLKTITDLAAGRPVDDKEVEMLMGFVASKANGKGIENFQNAIESLRKDPRTAKAARQLDEAYERIKANPVVQSVLKAAAEPGANCESVKKALEQRDNIPVFTNREQKNSVKIALSQLKDSDAFDRVWTGCLDAVGVAEEGGK